MKYKLGLILMTFLLGENVFAGNIIAMAFDWDKNIMDLDAPVVLFSKSGGPEIEITSAEFAMIRSDVSKAYPDYEIRKNIENPKASSFRYTDALDQNYFLNSLMAAKEKTGFHSRKAFYFDWFHRAVNTRSIRPWTYIITSRGHSPEQFHEGLGYLAKESVLIDVPLVQNIFCVSCSLSPTAKLDNAEAKMFVIKSILDKIETQPLSASEADFVVGRSGSRMESLHIFHFSDDSPTYVDRALKDLGEAVQRGSWPSIKIIISYSGPPNPKYKSKDLVIQPDGIAREQTKIEFEEIESKLNPTRGGENLCVDALNLERKI